MSLGMKEINKDNSISTEEKKVTKKDLISIFLRSIPVQASQSFDKQIGVGCCFALMKLLKKLYTNTDDYKDALKRHLVMFNITPHISTFVFGIVAAMEEENAKSNGEFDKSAINNLKVGLMGPLSGIGDSFYWGTFRVIAAGIGISFASRGSILGPILYFLIYTTLHFIGKFYGTFLGYKLGINFLTKSEENNTIGKLSYGASILGLMVVGGMIASMVVLKIPVVIGSGDSALVIQDTLDSLFPGIMSIAITFGVYGLIKKGFKSTTLIIGIFVLCVGGSLLGIF